MDVINKSCNICRKYGWRNEQSICPNKGMEICEIFEPNYKSLLKYCTHLKELCNKLNNPYWRENNVVEDIKEYIKNNNVI